MAGEAVQVTVKILDREYQIACRDDERDDLIAAAGIVSDRMKDIRGRGSVIGTDRIAVMTALNMAHELRELWATQEACERVRDQVATLEDRVGAALDEHGDT